MSSPSDAYISATSIPTGTGSADLEVTPSTSATATTTTAPDESLAITGTQAMVGVWLGLLILIAGVAIIYTTRRTPR